MERSDFWYVLELFEDADSDPDGEGDAFEGSNDVEQLKARAEVVWKAQRFKMMVLWSWNARTEGYAILEQWP